MEHHHKKWLWKKKSTDNNVNPLLKELEQEIQTLRTGKLELETEVKTLTGNLSSTLSDCNNKEEQLMNKEKIVLETAAEVVSLRQELDKALQQRLIGEERISQLDAALKECTCQLRFVRDESEKRIHDAVTKVSNEFEKSKMILEEKLGDTNKWLAKVGVENTNLGKDLLSKEKSIDDLNYLKSKLEADLNIVSNQLYISKKDNNSLKYEVRVLEKEVQIRNEEREFNRRTADASHRKLLEGSKKTAKLESECQRLRVLVRKRLPGPAALAKMKNEVELLERRRKSNSNSLGLVPDPMRVNFLTEKLCASEEENKNLKDALSKKLQELRFSQTMYARAASKLSEIESQLEEIAKGPATTGDLASMSDFGSNDKVSCAESSCKNGRASDLSLMDDFIEMEKFAVVSCVGCSESEFSGNSLHEKSLVETEREKSLESSDKLPKAEVDKKSGQLSTQLEDSENAVSTQLKSERESSRRELKPEETQLRSDSEITAASEKLAECQETILNLGKQAKALASSSPKDAFSTPTNCASPKEKLIKERSTLLDLIVEDNVTTTKDNKSPKASTQSDGVTGPTFILHGGKQSPEKMVFVDGSKYFENDVLADSLAVVPRKRAENVSLWRKLLST